MKTIIVSPANGMTGHILEACKKLAKLMWVKK